MTSSWYAVTTKPQREALADLNLRTLGFETYFAYEKQRARSPKSKLLPHLTKIAFIPGYIFVRSRRDTLSEVHCAIGVSKLVYAPGGKPCTIPNDAMDEMMNFLGPTGKVFRNLKPMKEKFMGRIGQEFRFGEASKLFGLFATVASIIDDSRILAKLHFAICGQDLVEVPTSDVILGLQL